MPANERRLVGHEKEPDPPEPKVSRLTVEVTELPQINRGAEDQVTSFSVKGKAKFKGDITVKARGDVASAYWSVAPGMKLVIMAAETGEKTYTAQSIEIVQPVAKD